MKNWLLTLIVIIVALTNPLSVTPVTPEASVEDSIVVPSETPAEVPTEVPAEVPAEAPAEAAEDADRTILAAPVQLSELCPGVELRTMDFDDFTLTVPADTKGQLGQKAVGQVMLLLYEPMPTGTLFTPNVTLVWNQVGATYNEALVPSMAAATEKSYPQTISQLQQQGIAASNMRMLSAVTGSVGNLPTVDLLTTYDADYSGMGLDLQINLLVLQRTVFLGDKGVYVINITAEDLSECVRLSSILDTLVWKD